MNATMTPPAGPDATPPPRRRHRPKITVPRVLLGLVVAASFALWAVALLRVGVKAPPDTLTDPAFAAAAEPVCAAAVVDLEALPHASTAKTPEERAATLELANTRLTQMVAELRTIAPMGAPDSPTINAWLADWDTYLGDRAEYTTLLAQGETAQFQVTPRDNQTITKPMDNLAVVNGMLSCQTPGDVG